MPVSKFQSDRSRPSMAQLTHGPDRLKVVAYELVQFAPADQQQRRTTMKTSSAKRKAKVTFEFGSWSFGLDLTKLKRKRCERLTTAHVTYIGPFFLVISDLPFDNEAARTLYKKLNKGAVGNFERLRGG